MQGILNQQEHDTKDTFSHVVQCCYYIDCPLEITDKFIFVVLLRVSFRSFYFAPNQTYEGFIFKAHSSVFLEPSVIDIGRRMTAL